ncbi:MAG: toll/interleukin-1 receptor domain-containing protein [Pyrinomonadaceae bacterium]
MQRFTVFLSYTSREDEVKTVQPLVDAYCNDLLVWARTRGVEIFYDHFSLPPKQRSDTELKATLAAHIRASQFFTAFLSPSYVESRWCCFEWREAAFEVKPTHPIYWKVDVYQDPLNYDNPVEGRAVQADIKTRRLTDVTYVGTQKRGYDQAASECVNETKRRLRQRYSHLFPW